MRSLATVIGFSLFFGVGTYAASSLGIDCPKNLEEAESLRLRLLGMPSPFRGNPFELNLEQTEYGVTGRRVLSCLQDRPRRGRPAFQGSPSDREQFSACFSRLLEFQRFGENLVPPANANQAMTSLPEELLDPELAIATLSSADQNRALAIIDRFNRNRPEGQRYLAVPFFGHQAAIDDVNSNYRFFVYVPGDPIKYVMFSGRRESNDRNLESLTANVSVVAIARNPDGTRSSYFGDYTRKWSARDAESKKWVSPENLRSLTQLSNLQNPRVVYSPVLPGQRRDCHMCHQNGGIPIVFDGMNQSPFREQIKKINDSMAIAAPPRLDPVNGSHVPLPLGPPVGPERDRSDAWLDKCIAKDDLSRITFSMPGAKESLEYRQFRARSLRHVLFFLS